MTKKYFLKKTFIVFISIFFINTLFFAQEAPENTSERIKTKNGYVYQQTLEWQEVKKASKYVIIIQRPITNKNDSDKVKQAVLYCTQELLKQEKKEKSEHIDISSEEKNQIEEGFENVLIYGTKKTSVKLILPYGSYRYKVVTYIRNRAFKAPWHELEIRPALKPVIAYTEPKRFYIDIDNAPGLKLYGINLLPDSTFYFAGKPVSNVQILDLEEDKKNKSEEDKKLLTESERSIEKDSLAFFPDINTNDINENSFLIIVKNKGNYAYKYEMKKTFWYKQDFFIGAGYSPTYINKFTEYSDDLNNKFLWASPAIDLTWVLNKFNTHFYMGFSFQMNTNFFSQKLDKYTLKFNTIDMKFDLHNQFNFNKNWSLAANFGLNTLWLFNLYHISNSPDNNTEIICDFKDYTGLNGQLRLYYIFNNGIYIMGMADINAFDINEWTIRGGIFAGYRIKVNRRGRK